ncbi:uncharacterized protein LOC116016084 [Ipomoea triloba]|uniref:uncharacterized protein LOC116016084 n=1 Tax=Ipomoea triloba TaxID=35885 RepID=UPI00125E32EF|nr:uncharacterized protein LOC116016084 [Ipomoea triloba]
MAELPETAGAPATRTFADILSSTTSDFSLRPPERYKGMPAVTFFDEDIQDFSKRYKFALVGKFLKGRPSMSTLKKAFDQIGFGGTFSLSLLDNRHVLFNFDKEEDYQRCWLRKAWSIQGFMMRMLKWTPDFRPDAESPVVPVWIAFEGLPAHLHDKRALYSIANLIGPPLKVDASTLSHNRLSVARICIELNVLEPIPKQLWITNGSLGGFSQPVTYEYIPPYCVNCHQFGHPSTECRSRPRPSTQVEKTQVTAELKQSQPIRPTQRWRPIEKTRTELPTTEQQNNMATRENNDPPSQEEVIPDKNSNLGIELIDDHRAQPETSEKTLPGHSSDGEDDQNFELTQPLLQSWIDDSHKIAKKMANPNLKDFITVTHKKRRPRKDYSTQTPSVTTRLASGSITRVSFSHRLK